MSDSEEIQTALDKLIGLKDAANGWTSTIQPSGYWGNLTSPVISHREASEKYKSLEEALHRTIDAQLMILVFAISLHPLKDKTRTEWATIHNAETLARAINGGAE